VILAYEREPYRAELGVAIVERGRDGERAYAVLDDTICYPEGGGQPADRGWLSGIAIIDVQRVGGEIRHYLAGDIDGPSACLRLDWSRRFDHMQQHTAQHLITALAADEWGWQTTSFHLGATVSDIELDVAEITATELQRLEQAVAARVRRALPVTAQRVDPATYARLPVRSRGLPAGHRGDIRLVEIDGVDRNTCGGTHVANTAELEAVALLSSEPMRGGTRLHWIAGSRVRLRLGGQAERLAAMRRLFETSDDELLAVAEGKLARLQEAERRVKELGTRVAEEAAGRLTANAGDLIDGHFEEGDAPFLQQLARTLLREGEQRPALLTAGGPGEGFFVLCAAPRDGRDLCATGARVAAALDGRGGGTPELVQGKAGSLTRRAEAVRIATEELGKT
jgi:Ser-tRNA(Ala) deacylase AlaX